MISSDCNRVYTVTDYYDGIVAGVADFNGQPHYYECILEDEFDNYSQVFLLHPIDAETFHLALEDWDIWERWNDAREQGKVSLETHPALPEERERHDEISKILKSRLVVDSEKDIKAKAVFEIIEPKRQGKYIASFQVKWDVI